MSTTVNACTDVGGRGCPCAWHARKRVYHCEYAARRRAKAMDARRRPARTCPRRFGRYGVCGAVLSSDVIGGRLVVSCSACERMARGLCRDCPAPVAGQRGKARRCAACRRTAEQVAVRKYTENHRHELRVKGRLYYKRDDARRQRKNEYKKAWRAANPEKVKAYKRRESLTPSPKRLAYHAARRAREREALLSRERARHRGVVELRTCVTPGCDIVVTHRKKKCTRCKESARRAALALLRSPLALGGAA